MSEEGQLVEQRMEAMRCAPHAHLEQTVEAAIERLRASARYAAYANNSVRGIDAWKPAYFQDWHDAELLEREIERLRKALPRE